jgi:hypothetical protein
MGGYVPGQAGPVNAPLHPVGQHAQHRVALVREKAIADHPAEHLDAVRGAGVHRALIRVLVRTPSAQEHLHRAGGGLSDLAGLGGVTVPLRVPVDERAGL